VQREQDQRRKPGSEARYGPHEGCHLEFTAVLRAGSRIRSNSAIQDGTVERTSRKYCPATLNESATKIVRKVPSCTDKRAHSPTDDRTGESARRATRRPTRNTCKDGRKELAPSPTMALPLIRHLARYRGLICLIDLSLSLIRLRLRLVGLRLLLIGLLLLLISLLLVLLCTCLLLLVISLLLLLIGLGLSLVRLLLSPVSRIFEDLADNRNGYFPWVGVFQCGSV